MREKNGAEEELYISGKIVVHSRGNAFKSIADKEDYTPSCRSLICSYTMETNVSHALWCEFNISPEEICSEVKSKGITCIIIIFFYYLYEYIFKKKLKCIILYLKLKYYKTMFAMENKRLIKLPALI